MAKIVGFLLFLCLNIIIGLCSNKVAILRNKDIGNCSNCNCTVGIPIKSNSLLNEFTFCGKYNFKFLRDYVLMYMNAPQIYIRIMDFEEKVGVLLHDNSGYFFFFPNQTIKPESWQYVCLSVTPDSMKLVLNGEVVLDTSPNSVMDEFKETYLWLGGENMLKRKHRRFEGIITRIYLWPESIRLDDLILITTANKSGESIAIQTLFSWKIFQLENNTPSCVEYEYLEENDPLFKESFQDKDMLLIEHLTTFDAASYLCEAFGGELLVPQNDNNLAKVGSIIKNSDKCMSAFLGLTKAQDDQVVNLNGDVISFTRWDKNEPNGKEYEKCINIYESAKYNDINCAAKSCLICEMSPKHVFSLRGIIPVSMDRYYFVSMSGKEIEIRGFKETECIWNHTWNFGSSLKQDVSSGFSSMPPVGIENWNGGHKLKFTDCNSNEFTCHHYGSCISLDKRCDGNEDCPLDGSDEKNCTLMTLKDGYNKKYPSEGSNRVSISMHIYDLLDIKELEMKYKIFLKVEMRWYDSRILFRNLKSKSKNNQLSFEEIKKIWTPALCFSNSELKYVIAGQRHDDDVKDFTGKGYVVIDRTGNSQINTLEELDEDYVYPGNENPLIMENWIYVVLDCKFELKMYPFDNQVCSIDLVIPASYNSEFVMQWIEPPQMENLDLMEYEVFGNLEYNNTDSPLNDIIVYIKLRRRLSFHIFNTYIPSFCLLIIAVFTLFIDESHFEATIMVTLTSMLVIYTLYQSITANLPQTSYMKMIDVWIATCLIVPFIIIAIHITLDHMILKESDQVMVINKKEDNKHNSKKFLTFMQILLPLTVGIFCIVYWIIGLSYYYT